MTRPFSAVPEAQGLYDPRFEHDACGVAFVADLHGRASHRIVEQALTALHNLDHRGAAGAEPSSGDGAGMTVQVPDEFLRAVAGFDLPAAGAYAVGNAFLPVDDDAAARTVKLVEQVAAEENLTILGWRDLPTRTQDLGPTARSVMPRFRQLFVAAPDGAGGGVSGGVSGGGGGGGPPGPGRCPPHNTPHPPPPPPAPA